MWNGLLIFINSFILYWATDLFINSLKQIPNINNWTQDERAGLYVFLIAAPLVAAVNIETIIGCARKIWSSRR